MTEETMEALRVLWDSLYTEDAIKSADVILAFGCADPDVGERAARLYLQGYAPWLVYSGGLGKGTKNRLVKSEAETFADIAQKMGVSGDHVLLETRSSNTGENLQFSHALLQKMRIQVETALVVHQPNMGKRIRATLQKQWPESGVRFLIAPADRSLERYLFRLMRCGVTEYEIVCNIVGDFQRMDVYARMGYQTSCPMPADAWKAFELMKAWGYTKYVIA